MEKWERDAEYVHMFSSSYGTYFSEKCATIRPCEKLREGRWGECE
jgi:hypothetical protein